MDRNTRSASSTMRRPILLRAGFRGLDDRDLPPAILVASWSMLGLPDCLPESFATIILAWSEFLVAHIRLVSLCPEAKSYGSKTQWGFKQIESRIVQKASTRG
jgi:hypothetical protein